MSEGLEGLLPEEDLAFRTGLGLIGRGEADHCEMGLLLHRPCLGAVGFLHG